MTKIIAVSSQKGGVLKTSTAVNLACVYAKKGNKVLLVDMDTQGDVSVSFGINPDNEFATTIYDVLLDGVPPEYAIKPVYENIDLLPSNEDFSFFEFDVLTNVRKHKNIFYLMRENLSVLDGKYDYIIVDTPPNLGLVQGNVLSYVQGVIIPYQPEPFGMRSLIKILKSIREFKAQHNQDLEIIGVLGTLIDNRTALHREALQECRKYCFEKDIPMFDTVIPRAIKYANSIAYEQKPAVLTAVKDEEVQAYYELEGEVREWLERKERA